MSDGELVYIVWEADDGSTDLYTWDGATLGPRVDVAEGEAMDPLNLP